MSYDIESSLNNIWQNISAYFVDLGEHPVKIIPLILDIAIIVFFIVKILKFSKDSRVMQLIKGILFFIVITWLSGVLQLTMVHSILNAILPSGVVALIVIFQPEIRRGLEQLGTNKIFNFFGMEKDIATKTKEDIYKIVIAVEEMAKTKTGALIVLQRDIKLNDIIATGVEINSDISPQLLVNIFVPNTPLHDGAVIIENNKIKAAACILPLASNRDIPKKLGTRHRAAVGISKESDAIAIVVSEESGKVSLAKDGTLIIDVKEDALKKLLIKNIITNKIEDNKQNKITKLKEKIYSKQSENENNQEENKEEK